MKNYQQKEFSWGQLVHTPPLKKRKKHSNNNKQRTSKPKAVILNPVSSPVQTSPLLNIRNHKKKSKIEKTSKAAPLILKPGSSSPVQLSAAPPLNDRKRKKQSKSEKLKFFLGPKEASVIVNLKWKIDALDPLRQVDIVKVKKRTLKKARVTSKKLVREDDGLFRVPIDLICPKEVKVIFPRLNEKLVELLMAKLKRSSSLVSSSAGVADVDVEILPTPTPVKCQVSENHRFE